MAMNGEKTGEIIERNKKMKEELKKKLYYEDPYCREFTSKVISCHQGKKGYEVILEETAFYPEGGGQPADLGWLNEVQVLDTRERNGEVVHICDQSLEAGIEVMGKIDWDRRFRNMQQHTGEHIFSGLVHKRFGYHNVGFHMGKEFITIDFDGLLTEEEMQEMETAANQAVFENREVYCGYPSKEELDVLEYRSKKELLGDIRIVEIPGADICACCGTHVQRTGEIGMIKVTGNEKYKGGSRIFLQIGWQALEDYRLKTENVKKITALLSAKPEKIAEAAEKLLQGFGEQKQQISWMKKELLQYKADNLRSENGRLFIMAQQMDGQEIRMLCDLLLARQELVLVCTHSTENEFKFVLGHREGQIGTFAEEFKSCCRAKGGGKEKMMQGSASCTKEELLSFAKEHWQMETVFL